MWGSTARPRNPGRIRWCRSLASSHSLLDGRNRARRTVPTSLPDYGGVANSTSQAGGAASSKLYACSVASSHTPGVSPRLNTSITVSRIGQNLWYLRNSEKFSSSRIGRRPRGQPASHTERVSRTETGPRSRTPTVPSRVPADRPTSHAVS